MMTSDATDLTISVLCEIKNKAKQNKTKQNKTKQNKSWWKWSYVCALGYIWIFSTGVDLKINEAVQYLYYSENQDGTALKGTCVACRACGGWIHKQTKEILELQWTLATFI